MKTVYTTKIIMMQWPCTATNVTVETQLGVMSPLSSIGHHCSSAPFDHRWQYSSHERLTKILTTPSQLVLCTDAYVLNYLHWCSGGGSSIRLGRLKDLHAAEGST